MVWCRRHDGADKATITQVNDAETAFLLFTNLVFNRSRLSMAQRNSTATELITSIYAYIMYNANEIQSGNNGPATELLLIPFYSSFIIHFCDYPVPLRWGNADTERKGPSWSFSSIKCPTSLIIYIYVEDSDMWDGLLEGSAFVGMHGWLQRWKKEDVGRMR